MFKRKAPTSSPAKLSLPDDLAIIRHAQMVAGTIYAAVDMQLFEVDRNHLYNRYVLTVLPQVLIALLRGLEPGSVLPDEEWLIQSKAYYLAEYTRQAYLGNQDALTRLRSELSKTSLVADMVKQLIEDGEEFAALWHRQEFNQFRPSDPAAAAEVIAKHLGILFTDLDPNFYQRLAAEVHDHICQALLRFDSSFRPDSYYA